jgi:hypothetical protein
MSGNSQAITELFGIEVPIIQAPMLGIVTAGYADFMPLWCGQAARLSPQLSAAELTRWLSTPTRSQ